MDTEQIRQAKSQDEARDYAIEWQHWASTRIFSLLELYNWGDVFLELAQKFDLEDEFKENGII